MKKPRLDFLPGKKTVGGAALYLGLALLTRVAGAADAPDVVVESLKMASHGAEALMAYGLGAKGVRMAKAKRVDLRVDGDVTRPRDFGGSVRRQSS